MIVTMVSLISMIILSNLLILIIIQTLILNITHLTINDQAFIRFLKELTFIHMAEILYLRMVTLTSIILNLSFQTNLNKAQIQLNLLIVSKIKLKKLT